MRTVFQSMNEAERRMLLEGKYVSLLEAGVHARPPETGTDCRIVCSVATPFGEGTVRWLRDELSSIRSVCAGAGRDLSSETLEVIRTRVLRQGKGFPLWALSWPAIMLMNNGSLSISCEQFVRRSVMDAASLARAEQRMQAIRERMAGILARLKKR
jgi:hypothetical protein